MALYLGSDKIKRTFIIGSSGSSGDIDALIEGSLTEINSNAATVRPYAFYEYTTLESINLPHAVEIGSTAFRDNIALTTVNAPKVETIGTNAFYYCTSLTNVELPSLKTSGMNAFQNCFSLASITLPKLEKVNSYMFSGCSELTRVDLHIALDIRSGAFSGCNKLETVILRSYPFVSLLENSNAFTNTPIASGTGYIYVPKAMVDSYKTGNVWSTYANQIRAIEDYPEI